VRRAAREPACGHDGVCMTGMNENGTPRPDGQGLTLARLKRLAERHPALGFALVPVR